MKVSEIGEFGLIERLEAELGEQPDAAGRLLAGIGDDAAAWRVDGAQIATTDTLVRGVHFRAGDPWRDLGWKALAVNVSDVAAMGGYPEYALVTLALPGNVDVEDVLELYRGLAEAGRRFGVLVAGGDVVRAPEVVITVALTGRATVDDAGEPLLLRRDAARPGDALAVTGTLGDSAGGLLLAAGERPADGAEAAYLLERHHRPHPRPEVGQAAARLGLRCAIDVSDGLAQDLTHVCRLSGLGACVRVESLPLSPQLRAAFGERARDLAISGGEDYELLIAGPASLIDQLADAVDTPLTVIGEMADAPVKAPRFVDAAGAEVTLVGGSWDHFASRRAAPLKWSPSS